VVDKHFPFFYFGIMKLNLLNIIISTSSNESHRRSRRRPLQG